jgi:hypothetical protein
MRPRPVPKKKSRAPVVIGVLLVLAVAGLGGYLAFGEQIRRTLGMGGPSPDSLAHARQLAAAESLATQHRADSIAAKTRADSIARAESLATARRTASREKPGTQRTAERETKPPPEVSAQSTAINCDAPTTSIANPNKACWSTRPNPLSTPTIVAPAACTGVPSPATVLVHVAATGEVVGTPSGYGSNCAQFNQAAGAYVQDMRFSPATKNGQNVSAWIRVLIQPRR